MIKKLTLLNETILECLKKKNAIKTVKAFTEVGIKILEADFGFVWLKGPIHKKWVLVYKTPNLPFQPKQPRATGKNYGVITSGKIQYIKRFIDTPYHSNAGKHMKSFMIIPISYREKTYGTLVLCFKKQESFSTEKRILSAFLGNSLAQAITVQRLVISEYKARVLSEKTKILLQEEKLKNDFIYNATHEFRTPLAIMRGNIDLALLGKTKKKSIESTFKAINHEIDHLSGVISDLTVLISKEKELKDVITFKEVNLSKLIGAIVKRCQIIANKKNISIRMGSTMADVMGDKRYLEKLLENLIRNAINYGKENGKILITSFKKKGEVVILISDNGIGISKDDLPYIFDRFYRADKSHNSSENTGLGLAISKWIIEAHGGSIRVKSTVGKGTTFTIVLPAKN